MDKPAGLTSFEALAGLKRALGTGRVGHSGTLDKFATGLLIVLCGSLTRLVRFVEGQDKTYLARVHLGVETDTLDPEGAVLRTAPAPGIGALRAVIPKFLGTISQVPPAYSALHVGGRRAHEIVRSGGTPALQPRTVRISAIDVLDYEAPYLELRVRCSRGTYVRSLARDIGREAGSCAHVAALRRTAVGDVTVEEARTPEDFRAERDLWAAGAFLRAHGLLRTVSVDSAAERALSHGRVAPLEEPIEEGEVACLAPDDTLVAVAHARGGFLHPSASFGRGR